MTPAEILAEALSEQAASNAWDSEFTPNPHDPWRAASKLATAEAALAESAGLYGIAAEYATNAHEQRRLRALGEMLLERVRAFSPQ